MRTLQENQSLNLEYQRNKELRELKDQLQQKENIIKEVRKYIENKQKLQKMWGPVTLSEDSQKELLEILDKGE